MPTGDDFRSGANFFRNAKRRLFSSRHELGKDWSGVAVGGPLEGLIDRTLDASRTNLDDVRELLDELADRCDERAAACDDYDYQISVWNSAFYEYPTSAYVSDAELPPRPQPEHPWIDASVRFVY